MFTVVFSIFKLLGNVFSGYFTEKVALVQAEAGVETAAINATASVETRWWFVAAMIPVFALPYAIWEWKAIVWDKVIEHGLTRTDPLSGPLAWGFPVVLGGLFMHWLIKQ